MTLPFTKPRWLFTNHQGILSAPMTLYQTLRKWVQWPYLLQRWKNHSLLATESTLMTPLPNAEELFTKRQGNPSPVQLVSRWPFTNPRKMDVISIHLHVMNLIWVAICFWCDVSFKYRPSPAWEENRGYATRAYTVQVKCLQLLLTGLMTAPTVGLEMMLGWDGELRALSFVDFTLALFLWERMRRERRVGKGEGR